MLISLFSEARSEGGKMKNTRVTLAHLLISLALGTLSLPVTAAPVTFRFEATIDTVFDTIPFVSGIDVAVGDSISGMFSFEPEEANGNQSLEIVQPYVASIHVDGKNLVTPSSMQDLTLRSFNNRNIADFPPGLLDTIEVGGSLGPEDATVLPDVTPSSSSFRLSLFGDHSILDAASFPREPSVWNSFLFGRSILVGIRGESGKSLGINAVVREFALVPESETVSLAIAALVFSLSCRFKKTNNSEIVSHGGIDATSTQTSLRVS